MSRFSSIFLFLVSQQQLLRCNSVFKSFFREPQSPTFMCSWIPHHIFKFKCSEHKSYVKRLFLSGGDEIIVCQNVRAFGQWRDDGHVTTTRCH